MAQIGIIGSGNLGANAAFFLAERNVAHVRLTDVQEGLSTGKSLDMMEAAPLRAYQYRLRGADTREAALESDVVVVAAGAIRQPGQKRDDLYGANAPLLREIGSELRGYPGVVLVATEPVDAAVTIVARASQLPWQRVLGIGTVLDSLRLRSLIAVELGVATEDVSATVIGRHTEEMVALVSYCTVAGVPIEKLLSPKAIASLVDRARAAGDEILDLAKRTNAFYGPAAAITDVAEAVVRDSGRVLPVSFVLGGQYGITGVALSLPAILGSGGVRRALEPKLGQPESKQLTDSAAALAAMVEK